MSFIPFFKVSILRHGWPIYNFNLVNIRLHFLLFKDTLYIVSWNIVFSKITKWLRLTYSSRYSYSFKPLKSFWIRFYRKYSLARIFQICPYMHREKHVSPPTNLPQLVDGLDPIEIPFVPMRICHRPTPQTFKFSFNITETFLFNSGRIHAYFVHGLNQFEVMLVFGVVHRLFQNCS